MGVIGWFARNGVAANLLAALIVVGGAISVFSITQEVFPEFDLDILTVSVEYLGAAPDEVEESVCVRIEEAIQGLDGVKEVSSIASEGMGVVTIELENDADGREVLDNVKSRVDAIDTFPEETEKPIIQEITSRRQVINLAVSGDVGEHVLRDLAERIRDDVAALPQVTVVELSNARPYEISIEVAEQTLRRHGLTLGQVANMIRRSSLDLPGGSVKTGDGEILLRTKGQRYEGHEFERLVLMTRADGTHLELGDVATIIDGFRDTDQSARFDGKPTMLLAIYRVGNQDALKIAGAVKSYVDEARRRLPAGVTLTPWNDQTRILLSRRNLLVRNGIAGLTLVLISLALFLRFRLAFWVAIGLIIAFMGTFWVMPGLDVSVNLISLFAFILVLGIVVDDAIIVGENVYTHQRRTGLGLESAIAGTREVATPVVFAVLTSVAAFVPMLSIDGTMGKMMRVIPLIVIPCLLWSLVESMWILPAHLSHYHPDQGARHGWLRVQGAVADGLRLFVARVYRPVLDVALRWRYMTIALGATTLLLTAGLVAGGRVDFIFFPDVESDFMSASLTLEPGSPAEETAAAIRKIERAATELREELKQSEDSDLFKYMVAVIGEQPFSRSRGPASAASQRREVFSHLGEMMIELQPSEVRDVGSDELVRRWREKVGEIPGAVELRFAGSLFSAGDDIQVRLSGRDTNELRTAADDLKQRLAEFAGVHEISDSFRRGKHEIKLAIKPEAEMLGLTLADLGQQVRQAFYGDEAQRIQRGRDDVRVMVRYPEDERRSLGNLEEMRIRTPDGSEIPFSEVARVISGRGYSAITRVDRRRTIDVKADVDENILPPGDVIAELEARIIPELEHAYPNVRYSFEGQQSEQHDTMTGLARGFALALVMIFGLLAVPLRSYVQPLLIMTAIPLGIVGAIWGHIVMGLDLTILSMFGLVALTGVVVNDSLVLVDFINRFRAHGGSLDAAVKEAGATRFRPIMLTSLTTFLGLSPLMLERSVQARFLIPMAVSLAFGVVFATFITLVFVPSGYMIIEDVKRFFARTARDEEHRSSPAAPSPSPSEVEA